MAAKRFVWMLAVVGWVMPAAAQNLETDPIRCWWRTSAAAVRAGEAFSLVLTCAVVENDAAKVIVDQAKLEPSVVQFTPFEVVPSASSHGPDLRTGERRFFQYEYRLRLVAENLFGKDVALPETKLSYHVQSKVGQATAIQGRDQSYVLPPLSIRVLSLVSSDAGDIRDSTVETFSDIDQRSFRANVLVVVGGILLALAALMALVAIVRLIARYRKPSTTAGQLVSDGAILRAIGRELRAVQRAREGEGWTPQLAARALGALRIASAYALGRRLARSSVVSRQSAVNSQPSVSSHQAAVASQPSPVNGRQTVVAGHQSLAERLQSAIGGDWGAAESQSIDGQLTVRSGWPRARPIAVSASVTPQALAHQLARGTASPRRAAMLEALEQALTRFTAAQYGRETRLDDAALDDSLAAASRTLTQLKIDQTWLMKRLLHRRASPELESRAWSR
jgi:hypothetical protein